MSDPLKRQREEEEQGVWRVFVFWSACMSDMNVRPPKEAERSLHSAARRAAIRRGGKNRAAPVGMTNFGRLCFGGGFMSDMNVRPTKEAERSLHFAARRATIRRAGENRAAPVGMTKGERGGHDVSCPYGNASGMTAGNQAEAAASRDWPSARTCSGTLRRSRTMRNQERTFSA